MNELSDPLRRLEDILKPDPRQENLAQKLEDVHQMLSRMTLSDSVPSAIRQLFETAKNVRLYTYFVYTFHQVAEMAAYQALEMALLVKWRSCRLKEEDAGSRPPTLGLLLRTAAEMGWIRNEGFVGATWRAERALIAERAAAGNQPAQDSEAVGFSYPTETEIKERAATMDVVSALVKSIPKMRNSLAHGSARLMPVSDYVLMDVRDAINMIFSVEGGSVA